MTIKKVGSYYIDEINGHICVHTEYGLCNYPILNPDGSVSWDYNGVPERVEKACKKILEEKVFQKKRLLPFEDFESLNTFLSKNKVGKFWVDRIRQMIYSIVISNSGSHLSYYSLLSIDSNFPLNKSRIRFIRCADGKEFEGFLEKDKWKVREVK